MFPAVCKAIKAEFYGEKRVAPGGSTDVAATTVQTRSEFFHRRTRDPNLESFCFYIQAPSDLGQIRILYL